MERKKVNGKSKKPANPTITGKKKSKTREKAENLKAKKIILPCIVCNSTIENHNYLGITKPIKLTSEINSQNSPMLGTESNPMFSSTAIVYLKENDIIQKVIVPFSSFRSSSANQASQTVDFPLDGTNINILQPKLNIRIASAIVDGKATKIIIDNRINPSTQLKQTSSATLSSQETKEELQRIVASL